MLRAALLTWLLCRYVTRHVNPPGPNFHGKFAGTCRVYPARAHTA
jgi:hypothetical protein